MEIEIATGKVLTDFHNVHDLTPLGDITGDAQVVNFPGRRDLAMFSIRSSRLRKESTPSPTRSANDP